MSPRPSGSWRSPYDASAQNITSILYGDGQGQLSEPVSHVSGEDIPVGVRLGDLDTDGRLDLVVVNSEAGSMSVLLNAGEQRVVDAGRVPAAALGDRGGRFQQRRVARHGSQQPAVQQHRPHPVESVGRGLGWSLLARLGRRLARSTERQGRRHRRCLEGDRRYAMQSDGWVPGECRVGAGRATTAMAGWTCSPLGRRSGGFGPQCGTTGAHDAIVLRVL